MKIKLRNTSKSRHILIPQKADRSDGRIITEPVICKPGKVGIFDPDNPSVKVMAIGGALVPADAESKKWFQNLGE